MSHFRVTLDNPNVKSVLFLCSFIFKVSFRVLFRNALDDYYL